jgi:hypothetical protein
MLTSGGAFNRVMASQDVELKVFKQFVALLPNFAGRPVASIAPGSNPPDVICTDGSGGKIGIELSEWLHQQQIAREKPRHDRESALRKAINSSTVDPPARIGSVYLFSRHRIRVAAADLPGFRDQLYSLVERLDKRWDTFKDHDHPHGVNTRDFDGFPLLAKYLTGMLLTSRRYRAPVHGTPWIDFFPRGGAYSPETGRAALEQALARKTGKYATLRQDAGLDELYLLLYYDQAHFYNTPFDSPGFGFPEIASRLARLAASDHGVFDRIFLCIPAQKLVAQIF